MSPGDFLTGASQIGVALLGFTGIAVALDERSLAHWSAVDKLKLRLLVTFSAVPLVESLLALLLLSLGLSETILWRASSLMGLVITAPVIVGLMKRFRSIAPHDFKSQGGSRLIFVISALLGASFTVFQLGNTIFLGRFWPFFALIVFQYVGATSQFVRFILYRPG
jgi:hypothetical protein